MWTREMEMWTREMEWLLSIADSIVELTPSVQELPDGGGQLEVMVPRPRSDLFGILDRSIRLGLFGVEVHGQAAVEDKDEEPFELKKSSSMPNLASIPLLPPGEASNDKGYASDDDGLASTPQLKRRRRKAHERKKEKSLFLLLTTKLPTGTFPVKIIHVAALGDRCTNATCCCCLGLRRC